MQDISKLLEKAQNFAQNKDISAKRQALPYFVMYSALGEDKKEAGNFIKGLIGEEEKAGRNGIENMLFAGLLGYSKPKDHLEQIRFFLVILLHENSLSILRRLLMNPSYSIDEILAHTPNIKEYARKDFKGSAYWLFSHKTAPRVEEYLKKEFKCSGNTAHAMALFFVTWHEEIKKMKDYLAGQGEL